MTIGLLGLEVNCEVKELEEVKVKDLLHGDPNTCDVLFLTIVEVPYGNDEALLHQGQVIYTIKCKEVIPKERLGYFSLPVVLLEPGLGVSLPCVLLII